MLILRAGNVANQIASFLIILCIVENTMQLLVKPVLDTGKINDISYCACLVKTREKRGIK